MEIIIYILIGVWIGYVLIPYLYNNEKKNIKELHIDTESYNEFLKGSLKAKILFQEEQYKIDQETHKRTRERYEAMNDMLVETGHCPYGELYTNADGTSAGYGGMMVSQEEWDKSELGQLYRKWHLERKQKEKEN